MTDEFDSDVEDFGPDEDEGEEKVAIDIISPAVKQKLRNLVMARDARDAAKVTWQRLKDDCEVIEMEVFDMFEDMDEGGEPKIKGTLKVPLGPPYGTVAFRTRETHFAKIIDDEAVQNYYEQRAMMEEVSAPKFVAARLNEEVRECLDLGKDLPPGMSYTTNRGMTITKQKG